MGGGERGVVIFPRTTLRVRWEGPHPFIAPNRSCGMGMIMGLTVLLLLLLMPSIECGTSKSKDKRGFWWTFGVRGSVRGFQSCVPCNPNTCREDQYTCSDGSCCHSEGCCSQHMIKLWG